jgi:hypothetical protein
MNLQKIAGTYTGITPVPEAPAGGEYEITIDPSTTTIRTRLANGVGIKESIISLEGARELSFDEVATAYTEERSDLAERSFGYMIENDSYVFLKDPKNSDDIATREFALVINAGRGLTIPALMCSATQVAQGALEDTIAAIESNYVVACVPRLKDGGDMPTAYKEWKIAQQNS